MQFQLDFHRRLKIFLLRFLKFENQKFREKCKIVLCELVKNEEPDFISTWHTDST